MSNKKLEEEENVHSWEDIVGEDCWGYGNLTMAKKERKNQYLLSNQMIMILRTVQPTLKLQ